jgi:hypothetical protein
MENGFSSPDFSAFGQIPNAAPPPQPGGESGWLKATNAVLTVASLAPGPVGAIASAAQAGLDLVQGHYIEAGIGVAGVALSFVGLGVAAKAIKLAREAREAKMAESLAVDAGKEAVKLSQKFNYENRVYYSFKTSKGFVNVDAEIAKNGGQLHLKDIAVFPESGPSIKPGVSEVLQIRDLLSTEARAQGFNQLRITGQRISGANSGKLIDTTIDLTK